MYRFYFWEESGCRCPKETHYRQHDKASNNDRNSLNRKICKIEWIFKFAKHIYFQFDMKDIGAKKW